MLDHFRVSAMENPAGTQFLSPRLHLIVSLPLTWMGPFASHGEVKEPDVGRAL